jgi:D-amino-acid dehydrogenase
MDVTEPHPRTLLRDPLITEMHIVVIGAGIAGTVTALALARRGYDVTIFETADSPATGASFANAGLISPGHCFSWAEPGVIGTGIKSLLGLGDGMGICPPWNLALLRWCALFAREGRRERWLKNSAAALALSAYSRDLLFNDVDIPLSEFGGRKDGILYLYSDGDFPSPYDSLLLKSAGEEFQQISAEKIKDFEPLLNLSSVQFSQATYSPNDGTGDAAKYARAALKRAISLGTKVRYSERVRALETDGDRVVGLTTNLAHYKADAIVVSAGLASRCLLASLGYRLPIHPVTGYSISFEGPRRTHPRIGAVSIRHKVAWASFGDSTVRFTGFADIGIPGPRLVEKRFARLESFASDICPELFGVRPNRWVGQRPMTPDNLPFLGPSRHSNLWLNCGHGAMGWTMARGAAKIISDLISGNSISLDLTPFRWDRYRLFEKHSL